VSEPRLEGEGLTIDRRILARIVVVKVFIVVVILGALLFVPAGTLEYWNAWIYLAVLLLPAIAVMVYFFKTDPELIERRMKVKEQERQQRRILHAGTPLFVGSLVLPGLDWRLGWSAVPLEIALGADALIVVGYLLFARVLKENRFASRVIEVVPGQKVITSGPYAVIRHPMYVGVLLIYVFSPLALGSYWALLVSVWFVPVIVARILNEEAVLQRDLAGFTEYMTQTRYRLLPGLW
jgi:protein-S-isoprenylcysteine O-methyltransferase Ste14